MRPGSVIVDLAAEQGGNSRSNRARAGHREHGVIIIGPINLPSTVPFQGKRDVRQDRDEYLVHLSDGGPPRLGDELTRAPGHP